MTTRQVSLEVNGKLMLDADVSAAERKVKDFSQTIGNGAPVPPQQGGPAPAAPNAAPTPGSPPSPGHHGYNAQRSADSAESRMGQARTPSQFQSIAEQLERAMYNAQLSGNKALTERIKDLTDELGGLQSEMEKTRAAEKAAKDAAAAAGGSGGGGGGGDPHGPPPGLGGLGGHLGGLGNWLNQQGESSMLGGLSRSLGGPLGSLLGGLGSKVLGGPLGLVLGAGSAANYAFNAISNNVTEGNAEARNEIMGNADLARQYGSTGNFMAGFRNENGWTNKRFSNLGYSATQAAHVSALYDRPGGMMNDTESILGFSRTMGVDESRTAGMARTLGLAGIGGKDGGNVGEGLRTIKLAMMDGIKLGIAGSDTMNALLGIAQKAQQEGRSMNNGGLAYYTALGSNMNKTGDIALKGAAGMNVAQGFLEGFGQQGGDPGMEMMLIQGMGKLPDSKKLGLKGGQAKAFDQMRKQSPVAAARYMLSQLKNGNNPALVDQISKTIDDAAGDNVVLKQAMYKQLSPGSSDEQIMDAIGNGGLTKLMHVEKKDLARAKDGAGTTADVQGRNPLASSTMYLRVADADRAMVKSLTSLKLFGGLEETFSSFKSFFSDFRATMVNIFGPNAALGKANYGGRVGEGKSYLAGSPQTAPAPNDGLNVPYTPGQAAAGAGTDRMLASMAQVESTNGTNPNMNAGKATGLFQVMGSNLVGKDGWAKKKYGFSAKTAEEGKAWLMAHPDAAAQIGADRLTMIRSQIAAKGKKDGLSLNDNQLTAMTGVLYHRNGGASLAPLEKDGKINADYRYLSRDSGPDGVSDYDYYNKVSDAFGSRTLKAANMPGHAQGQGDAGGGTAVSSGVLKSIGGGTAAHITQSFGDNKPWQGKDGKWWYKDLADGKTKAGKGPYGVGGHDGTDMVIGGGEGAAVHTPFGGKVYRTKGFMGNEVTVVGKSGYKLIFGHLTDKAAAGLESGQSVGAGATIGYQGHSGKYVAGTHLHFEIQDPKGNAVAPGSLLKKWETKGGFRSGGYTGGGARHDEAGTVHGQEFVMNADATARYRSTLEAMNSGHGGGGNVNLNLSGTLQLNVSLSGSAQTAIQREYLSFQNKAGRIAAGDIQNTRGVRG